MVVYILNGFVLWLMFSMWSISLSIFQSYTSSNGKCVSYWSSDDKNLFFIAEDMYTVQGQSRLSILASKNAAFILGLLSSSYSPVSGISRPIRFCVPSPCTVHDNLYNNNMTCSNILLFSIRMMGQLMKIEVWISYVTVYSFWNGFGNNSVVVFAEDNIH